MCHSHNKLLFCGRLSHLPSMLFSLVPHSANVVFESEVDIAHRYRISDLCQQKESAGQLALV